jgi:exodeoxyribonuclease VII small subunit
MANQKQENNDKDIEKIGFEETIRLLTNIVEKIEQGKIPLQESIEQYEKGMGLIRHCRDILQKAEKKIELISQQDKEKD